jgi:hypothetical protein
MIKLTNQEDCTFSPVYWDKAAREYQNTYQHIHCHGIAEDTLYVVESIYIKNLQLGFMHEGEFYIIMDVFGNIDDERLLHNLLEDGIPLIKCAEFVSL